MADDEGNAIWSERTDLNLYLGFPRTGVEEEDESTAMSAAPPPPSDDPPPPPPPPPPPIYPFYPPDGLRRPGPVDLAELLRQLDDDPVLPAVVDEGHAHAHALYSPSHLTVLSARSYLPPDSGSSAGAYDGPSPPHQFFQSPESQSRFRRLIESNRRIQIRRVRPSTTEQLVHGIVSTQKHRGRAEGTTVEGSEGEDEDKSISAANFECNICLNMAKDPVVTSCGHLFCWPCLYQWLHIHSDHHECPVCKGHVDDAKLTPIYGRGSSEAAAGEKRGDEGELGLKIPPRPNGHRIDSLRQQLRRPITRRMREGSPTSWSRILEDENAHLQNLLDIAHNMVLSRLGEIRRQTEEVNNIENGLNVGRTGMPGNNTLDPQISTTTSLRDELNHVHQPPLYSLAGIYRLAADSTELVRAAGRFENGSIPAGTSASSVNNHDPEPLLTRALSEATLASSQAYASSTMAVIQGDTAVNEAAVDTYSAGPSRSHRRRGRSGTSGSLDADGGELHVRKRRRLN